MYIKCVYDDNVWEEQTPKELQRICDEWEEWFAKNLRAKPIEIEGVVLKERCK